jgi:hypothetical protein
MFKRQLRSGVRVFLGGEDHPGDALLLEDSMNENTMPLVVSRDLGWMVHGPDYEDRGRLRFFRAILDRGIVSVPAPGSVDLFA